MVQDKKREEIRVKKWQQTGKEKNKQEKYRSYSDMRHTGSYSYSSLMCVSYN